MTGLVNRRGFIASAAILFGNVVPLAASTDASDEHNGFFWEELRADHRLFYVLGFRDGASSVNEQWEIDTQGKKSRPSPNAEGVATISINNSSLAQAAANYSSFDGVANGQLLEGLDHFYSDFRNKLIHIAEAMQYVKDQVKGKDPVQLEKNLMVLRKYAGKT